MTDLDRAFQRRIKRTNMRQDPNASCGQDQSRYLEKKINDDKQKNKERIIRVPKQYLGQL